MGSMDRFPYLVESPEELAEAVSEAIRQHQPAQSIRGIVVLPPQDYIAHRSGLLGDLAFGWRKTPQRTLAFGSDQLTIVAVDSGKRLTTTNIPLDAVTDTELTIILLYAYLQLTWVRDGQVQTAKMEFNSVGEPLIREQLDYLRGVVAAHPQRAAESDDPGTRAPGPGLPLKFHNYLRLALLPKEKVVAEVYQPAIRRTQGWLRPLLSPNRAVAITDRHVILVEDVFRRRVNYGVVTRFFPLLRVQRVTFETTVDAVWVQFALGTTEAVHDFRFPVTPKTASILQSTLGRSGVTSPRLAEIAT